MIKKILLKINIWIFGVGFIISGIAFIYQGWNIYQIKDAHSISLITFILFAVLNINGTLYGYYVAKDKILMTGTILNILGCSFIVILKLLYGGIMV